MNHRLAVRNMCSSHQELGHRCSLENTEEGFATNIPANVAHSLTRDKEQEHLVALLINNQGHLLGTETIHIGSSDTCLTRIGELFRAAVRKNAVALIIGHTHPSGDPTPNAEDKELTKQVFARGQILNIQVLDVIIVGHNTFVSMRHRGLAFEQEGAEDE